VPLGGTYRYTYNRSGQVASCRYVRGTEHRARRLAALGRRSPIGARPSVPCSARSLLYNQYLCRLATGLVYKRQSMLCSAALAIFVCPSLFARLTDCRATIQSDLTAAGSSMAQLPIVIFNPAFVGGPHFAQVLGAGRSRNRFGKSPGFAKDSTRCGAFCATRHGGR